MSLKSQLLLVEVLLMGTNPLRFPLNLRLLLPVGLQSLQSNLLVLNFLSSPATNLSLLNHSPGFSLVKWSGPLVQSPWPTSPLHPLHLPMPTPPQDTGILNRDSSISLLSMGTSRLQALGAWRGVPSGYSVRGPHRSNRCPLVLDSSLRSSWENPIRIRCLRFPLLAASVPAWTEDRGSRITVPSRPLTSACRPPARTEEEEEEWEGGSS